MSFVSLCFSLFTCGWLLACSLAHPPWDPKYDLTFETGLDGCGLYRLPLCWYATGLCIGFGYRGEPPVLLTLCKFMLFCDTLCWIPDCCCNQGQKFKIQHVNKEIPTFDKKKNFSRLTSLFFFLYLKSFCRFRIGFLCFRVTTFSLSFLS